MSRRRLLPAVLVTPFGEEAIVVGSAIATAASVFAILGLKDLVSAVVIAVIYGLFIGMCKYASLSQKTYLLMTLL